MPTLSFKKRNLGIRINSKALVADSKEILVCAFLSVSLLMEFTMNYLFGFWQADPLVGLADPLVGLIVVVFLIREGQESWEEANENEKE